jgi:hypothetical protein
MLSLHNCCRDWKDSDDYVKTGQHSQDIELAFSRGRGVPALICTVIVHNVILLHPVEPVDVTGGQRVILRLLPPLILRRHAMLSIAIPGHASVHAELLVVGDEGRARPVELHPAVAGGPVVAVPDRAEDPHWL